MYLQNCTLMHKLYDRLLVYDTVTQKMKFSDRHNGRLLAENAEMNELLTVTALLSCCSQVVDYGSVGWNVERYAQHRFWTGIFVLIIWMS